MEPTMKERKKVTLKVSLRYQKAPKKEKDKILDEFISLTNYNRAYASFILNNYGRKSRPYRKNDSCFVEQKNYSVVKRTVGHFRYDTDEELDILNKLYSELRLYSNFFLPSQKLIEKIRSGSKIKKIYDEPKTPFKRIIASNFVPKHYKNALLKQYSTLNPAQLKRHISALQDKLFDFQKKKPKIAKFNQNLIYNQLYIISFRFLHEAPGSNA